MKTTMLWLAMAGAALAQDRGTERQLNFLKERLSLSEEQSGKIREVYVKDQADREKLEEDRAAKVRELLTEEQRPKYDELRQQFRAGGQGQGRGQGGFGGPGGFGAPRGGPPGGAAAANQFSIESLKLELKLTDEQAEKIKPILDETQAIHTKRIEDLQKQGFQGVDWQAEMAKFNETVKTSSDQVKVHLNEEQKTKFDGMVERATAMFRMIPGFGPPRAAVAARPSAEDRIRRAVDALKIEKEDERSAVRDLIEKVVKAQDALEEQAKSSRELAGQSARNSELSEQALEDRLGEGRTERRRLEKILSDLQAALADVLSVRQETELVQQGILR